MISTNLKQNINNKIPWWDVKKKLVLNQKNTNPDNLKIMETLVQQRDVLDDEICKKSVASLFPNHSFDIDVKRDNTETKYLIRNKNSDAKDCCQITFFNPGGKTLLSDVDISVMVTGANNLDMASLPDKIKKYPENEYPDYNGRIENILIDTFYSISEENKMSSALSRDTNIYSGKAVQNISNFHGNETIEKLKLNSKEFYRNWKGQKHTIELAAGFVTFCESFSKKEWSDFVMEIRNYLSEKFNSQKVIDDFNKAIKLTEQLVQYKEEKLTKAITSLSIQNPHDIPDEDLKISISNKLYIQHLDLLIDDNEKINKLERSLSQINLQFEPEKAKLILEKIADQKIKRQMDLVLSNLFANDTFINAGALQHTVMNIQKGDNFVLHKKVVLGSTLQNLAKRIVMAREERAQGLSEEFIMFFNSKYSHRIASLAFNTRKHLDDTQIRSIPLFQDLKINKDISDIFTLDELRLLNHDTKVFWDIKKNDKIPEYEKENASKCLTKERTQLLNSTNEERINKEENLYKSICKKVLFLTYLSKLTQKNGLLWGET